MSAKITELIRSAAKALRLDGFSITIVEGQNIGATLRAQTSEISVGTAPGNDLVLNDSTVSRHHFSITATPKGFLLRDLESSNGTWIGSTRMMLGYLASGARVRAGRTTMQIDQVDEHIYETLSPEERFGNVLGVSASMRRIFALLPRVAATESTVLLEGETGTGKGALALAIHETSPRVSGPFVVLDCSTIAPSLIESELFGHVKGSFTGAHSDRAGAFEQARGGTVFIDEIGELPFELQPKLLRALEERTVKRVGGNQRVNLDVRVIAATNRDLRAEVNKGTFRADLYYRLNVVRIALPPLRERTGDIERLARHFYAEMAPDKPISEDLVAYFSRQPWPGNVRELRAAVERAILFEDPVMHGLGGDVGSEVQPVIEAKFDARVPYRLAKQTAAEQWEESWVRNLLESANHNISEAARMAKMDRSHLYSLIRKYGVRAPEDGSG